MGYVSNRFCFTALLLIFSVSSIVAASFTNAESGHLQEPDPGKKEKPETKAPAENQLNYYVTITGGGYVTVADDFGRTNTPLLTSTRGNEIGSVVASRVPNVSVEVLGEDTVQLVMPAGQNYTLSFRCGGQPVGIAMIEGENNLTPLRAVRYIDLVLPAGARAMLRFASKGVEPLRYDQDGDGIYESIAVATLVATGAEARDVTPPVVKFEARVTGAKTKVTIKAADSGSGVKTIYYSLDNKTYRPYVGALLFEASSPPMVYAFADDRVGNRSSISSLGSQ